MCARSRMIGHIALRPLTVTLPNSIFWMLSLVSASVSAPAARACALVTLSVERPKSEITIIKHLEDHISGMGGR